MADEERLLVFLADLAAFRLAVAAQAHGVDRGFDQGVRATADVGGVETRLVAEEAAAPVGGVEVRVGDG
jgi:hypothetical protein